MSWLYKPEDLHVCQKPCSNLSLTFAQEWEGKGLPSQGALWQCDSCGQMWEVKYSGATESSLRWPDSVQQYKVEWRKYTLGGA